MELPFDHNRLLKKIAKERLTPYGIVQEGKSRTFLYDNGWWTIVIEFQSSSWSKGSYLNIGIDFNFYPRNHFAFTYGYREKGFEEAIDEAQFRKLVNDYCDFTITKVDELKSKFKDVRTAINIFEKQVGNDPWQQFALGIMCSLAGNLSKCKNYLAKVQKRKCRYDYEFERQKLVIEILNWVNNNNETLLVKINELINQTRQLKKLPLVDLYDLLEIKPMPDSFANTGTRPKTMGVWNAINQRFGA